ncbi:MAG: OmpA family protein [Proteobacteria bacterium]|nr:OmpA family protein [Pseudomonadota bacterium]
MRRSVMLVYFLCLSAGAVAIAQVYRGQRFDALLTLHLTSGLHTAAAKQALTAVDHSASQLSSEDKTARAEASPETGSSDSGQSQTRPPQTDKPKSDAAGAPPAEAPKLTVARISGSGSASVFAGSAAPGASVTVLENGVPVASAKANDNGDWSLVTEHQFASGDPKITLSTGDKVSPGEDSTAAAPGAQLPQSAGAVAATEASPSVQVLKKFERIVASAREEAQAQSSVDSAAAGAPTPPPAARVATQPAPDVGAMSPVSAPLRDSAHLSSATIPVPMTFVFDEATLTPDGEKTAHLLLEYLLLKKFTAVTLSGHADERGTAEYNMELSRKRLDTISSFLRNGGYRGKMDLLPKGATEPFKGVDRSKFSRDDLMQLDRRVELQNAS